jgi:hypothetical protein
MGRRLANISFHEWVRYVFNHPVTEPAWHYNIDCDHWEEQALQAIEFLTRLFENPGRSLAEYSDSQLNRGFWLLLSSGSSNHMLALVDEGVSWPLRQRCIESIPTLFEKLFAVRCPPSLSHFKTPEPEIEPLNSACYMWWDIAPFRGKPEDPSTASTDAEFLTAMARILAIENDACRESPRSADGSRPLERLSVRTFGR